MSMTPSQVATLIRGRCGGRISSTDLNVYILQEMNAAQHQLETGPLWPWFLTKTFLRELDSNGVASMPDTFLSHLEDWPVYWVEMAVKPIGQIVVPQRPDFSADVLNFVSLKRLGFNETAEKYATLEGTPRAYTMYGNGIAVTPVPDSTTGYDRVWFTCIARESPIVTLDDAGNAWYTNAPELILNLAGGTIASQYIKDPELATAFGNAFTASYQQLVARSVHIESVQVDLAANESLRFD